MSIVLRTIAFLLSFSASVAMAAPAKDFRWVVSGPEGEMVVDGASISASGNVRGFDLYMAVNRTPIGFSRGHFEADCTTRKTRLITRGRANANGDGFDDGPESNPRWGNTAREKDEVRLVDLVCAAAADRDRYAPSIGGNWRGALATAKNNARRGMMPASMAKPAK